MAALLAPLLLMSGCMGSKPGGNAADKNAVVSPKNKAGNGNKGSAKQPSQNTDPAATAPNSTNPTGQAPGLNGATPPQPMGTQPVKDRTPTGASSADNTGTPPGKN